MARKNKTVHWIIAFILIISFIFLVELIMHKTQSKQAVPNASAATEKGN